MCCKNLFDIIDDLYNEYVLIWKDVCNIESPTTYKDGVDLVGEYFINIAKKFGWQVEVCKQKISANAICITMNENAKKPPIAISGHMDTVHPLGIFGQPPVKIIDDYIYGPGVADCKGGIVVGLMVMHALYVCGYNDRPIKLLLQSDEETNSNGSNKETIKFICQKAKDCVAFFNLEPHLKGKACLERKGIIKYIFTVTGQEAHSSVCATLGANAIAEAAYKILEIEKIKDELGVTCNVGVINGGSVANTVAGKCSFEVDVRFANQAQKEWAEEQLKAIAEKQFIKGCSTTLTQASFRLAMELCDKNLELLNKINGILIENGFSALMPNKSGGGSDAADVTDSGIPCIDSLGVESSAIHTPQERASISSLKDSAKRLAVIINCF